MQRRRLHANGARILPLALNALLARQHAPAEGFEVVIVDDRSTDGSAELPPPRGRRSCDSRTKRAVVLPPLATPVFERPRVTLSLSPDDDAARADLAGQLIEPMRDRAVDSVTGCTVPACDRDLVLRYLARRDPLAPLSSVLLESHRPPVRLRTYLRDNLGDRALPSGAPLYSVVGANMAFRLSFLDAMGESTRDQVGGEEEDLCRRAHERPGGARFVYAPAAEVRHHYRPGIKDTLRGPERMAEGTRARPPLRRASGPSSTRFHC